MTTTVDVIVLGTGSAAQNVAYTCRSAGWSVAVVDSRPFGKKFENVMERSLCNGNSALERRSPG